MRMPSKLYAVQIYFVLFLLLNQNIPVLTQTSSATETRAGLYECVKVTLETDTDQLSKKSPFLIVVRIHNLCERSVEIYDPFFEIEKSDLLQEKEKRKYGDEKRGRILRTKTKSIDNSTKTIESGQIFEINTEVEEIGWIDKMSSIEIFTNIFDDLKPGKYKLYATVMTELCAKEAGKTIRENIRSNKIEVRFD